MAAIRIQIARSTADTWEVRVVGPGGWRTSVSNTSLSAARHDAYAWARVLGIPQEDIEHD